MIASAEFFAPLIFTWPFKGYPPHISRTDESASGEDWGLMKP
jgi:hypothetical protein